MSKNCVVLEKRELSARILAWSGVLSILARLPAQDSLLVLAYHRIGNPDEDPFDPNMFSATAEEFSDQIAYLKRNHLQVTLEEALAFVDGTSKEKSRHCRVLITFDDGYLDNFEVAFPILRSHGIQGVFFLCTDLVGSSYLPWWDHIAYLVKAAHQRGISLRSPTGLKIDIDGNGFTESLRSIFNVYKTQEDLDPAKLIRELLEALGEDVPPAVSRRFLNWDEAREMVKGGMAIGAHTHSHRVLSKLRTEEQRRELSQCRAILGEKLGIKADVLAYPFGTPATFTEQTQQLAEETGFRAAFSYYGRLANKQGKIERYNLKRVALASQSLSRFRVQMCTSGLTGTFWP